MGMKLTGHDIILQYGIIPASPARIVRRENHLKKFLTVSAACVDTPTKGSGAPMRQFLSPQTVAFYTVTTILTRILKFQFNQNSQATCSKGDII
jgi:hypothetical protein